MEDSENSHFIHNLLFIYFGDKWDHRWRRRQQVAYRLARLPEVKGVIYIEYPLTFTSFLRFLVGKADSEATARWKRVLGHGLAFRVDGVHVLTPICPMSIYRTNELSRLNNQILKAMTNGLINNIMKDLEPSRKILWLSHIFASGYVGEFGEQMLCYDCTERFGQFENWSAALRERAHREDAFIASRADLVFTQTRRHCAENAVVNRNTYLVPNGVDYDLFVSNSSKPDLGGLMGVKEPILGYVGSINTRTDFQLLSRIARAHPEWSLVFVGAVSDGALIENLRELPNAHFLGERPYHQLPALVKSFDVCLIPYRRLTWLGSPIKLFDYLASGKPIVSTHIAGVEDFRDVVYIAQDGADFSRKIASALRESDPLMAQRRLMRAKENSWDARVSQIWKLIRDNLDHYHRGVL